MAGAIVSKLKLPPSVQPAGKPAPRAVPTAAELVRPSRPLKPAGLPEHAARWWDTLVDQLDESGLLATVDGPALELALRHYCAAIEASDALSEQGAVVWDEKNERYMKSPASQVFRDHSSAYLDFAKQLGLTFVSRAKVAMPKGADHAESGNPFTA